MQSPRLRSFLFVTAAVALALLLCAFIPYTSTEAPEWRVEVVDYNGQPVASAEVHQVVLFSGRSETWFETKTTDSQGSATFPKRTIRASLLDRASSRAKMYRAHYPYGASATAWVCWGDFSGSSDTLGTSSKISGPIRLKLEQGGCPYGFHLKF